jgi:hypothetical protein
MILAIALALVAQADTGRWIQVAQTARQTANIDARTIRVVGNKRIIWQRLDLHTPRPNGVSTDFNNVEIDCSARTLTLLGGTGRGRNGQVIENYAALEPIAASPNSVGEAFVDFACVRQGSD